MSKLYSQKFRKEWLTHTKLKDWIAESENSEKAYCKYCKCDIVAKFSCLEQHSETKKHFNALGRVTKNKPIPFKPVNYKLQQQEATLSMYIAVHSSIAPVDHLGEVCKAQFNCPSLKLHRTKCSKVIKNVLGPHFNEELANDIGNGYYSILIDESTDVSFTKILGMFISITRCFYKTSLKFITNFISFLRIGNNIF